MRLCGGSFRTMEQQLKKAKQVKSFNMSSFAQRRVAFKLAYLGWSYSGNTTQAPAGASLVDENTVEARLLEALMKIKLIDSVESCKLSRCGRTDKGVSAWANVVSLIVRSALYGSGLHGVGLIPPAALVVKKKDCNVEIDYVRSLNKVLPEDIRIVAWSPVALDFDARFKALARTYKYYFLLDGMNPERMREAAKLLEGEHDFRNFCKIDIDNTKTWTRSILSTSIEQCDQNPNIYYARIKIRYIMAVLFHVGRGLEQPSIVSSLLDIADVKGRPEFNMASDVPLVLYQCDFSEEDVRWEYGVGRDGVSNEFSLYSQLHAQYENLALRASMLHDMMREMEQEGDSARRREQIVPTNKYVPLLRRARLPSVEERRK